MDPRGWGRGLPWLVGLFGLGAQFWRILSGGFDRTHSGLGDARLVSYTLEHGYRWLLGIPPHERFWDAPLFHPHPNVSAFTDPMLGFGPLHWLWRALGAAPDTAFQLWMLSVYAANFAAAYVLLRIGVRVDRLAASGGALVGATLAVRWLHHPQLFPFFPVFLALTGLLLALDADRSRGERHAGILLFFAAVLVQGWAAFYPFFFFGLLAALALGVAALTPSLRGSLVERLRVDGRAWLGAGVVTALLLIPLLRHYGITAREIGLREYHAGAVAGPLGWVTLDSKNAVYTWLRTLDPERNVWNGAGLLAVSLAAAGMWAQRRRALVRALLPATATMALLATSYGGWSPWQYVHAWLPGAGAIRAHGRATMILVPFVLLGVGLLADHVQRRRHGRWVLLPLLALLVAEGWETVGLRSKHDLRARVASVAARVDPSATAFYLYSTEVDARGVAEDAEWASLATGIPTVNGRYGNFPPDYGLLSKPSLGAHADGTVVTREALETALESWLARHGIPKASVQVIEYTPPSPAGRVQR